MWSWSCSLKPLGGGTFLHVLDAVMMLSMPQLHIFFSLHFIFFLSPCKAINKLLESGAKTVVVTSIEVEDVPGKLILLAKNKAGMYCGLGYWWKKLILFNPQQFWPLKISKGCKARCYACWSNQFHSGTSRMTNCLLCDFQDIIEPPYRGEQNESEMCHFAEVPSYIVQIWNEFSVPAK